jgi:uncharacterized protein (DUF58 family)
MATEQMQKCEGATEGSRSAALNVNTGKKASTQERKQTMKQNRWFKWIGAAGLGLILTAMAAPEAQALTATAFVVKQTCVNSDFVRVTLSATLQPNQPAKYRWDFTNNGSLDTVASSSPTVTHVYPEDRRFTARVRAVTAKGVVVFDTVTFTTKSCGGGGT